MAVKPKQSCGGRKTTKRPFPFFKFKLIKVDKILDSKQTSIDSKKSQKDNSSNGTLMRIVGCKNFAGNKQEPNLFTTKREYRNLSRSWTGIFRD